MLSDDLKALANSFRSYLPDGVELTAEALAPLVACFEDLADQAHSLEAAQVPPWLRGAEPPCTGSNVLAFPRRDRGTRP